ncbi:PhzF family phenazine biosynthesis protein [Dyadobacter pollutisoli]|jgi:PhzF family phenazine biosynthesis protein|uniref:PhzF family phenazine biosynthesis protein n=1 Tax=Dyadobacter pollutisoli TaxID=2910158 RepID=A0A9E8SQ69_9BACT|nr:PhzF family phenazine biosynthesis protein [Dyadobacter pollutisoli]WAC12692.1 PhzF family phenazine biosynthesis protein [Dyadobacter pollutisoli]
MKSYKYSVVDVFTNEKYRGNPLAVVFTDTDLDLVTYENISREFGYSETSFIYYSKIHKALQVRSFTPTGFEVNGAGHNLLGAVCAALLKDIPIFAEQGEERFVIMKDERMDLSVRYSDDKVPFVAMRQQPATVLASVEPKILAAALNLDEDQVLAGNFAPSVVKTEVTHLMVPLKNQEALDNAVPDKRLLVEAAEKYDFEGVYCFTIPNENSGHFAHARFFNPGIGIDEDPATGSAAGPLAGFLFHQSLIKQDTIYQLIQGEKMNRPSVIQFEVKVDSIWISGSSVIVMEGTILE